MENGSQKIITLKPLQDMELSQLITLGTFLEEHGHLTIQKFLKIFMIYQTKLESIKLQENMNKKNSPKSETIQPDIPLLFPNQLMVVTLGKCNITVKINSISIKFHVPPQIFVWPSEKDLLQMVV